MSGFEPIGCQIVGSENESTSQISLQKKQPILLKFPQFFTGLSVIICIEIPNI